MNKTKLKKCFNQAADTYDGNCGLQIEVGLKLIKRAKRAFRHLKEPGLVLDLGCGTGIVTEHVTKIFKGAELHAIDIADKLLIKAKLRLRPYHNIKVYEGDFESLDLQGQLFDLIYANMSLQWGKLDNIFSGIAKHLSVHGGLAFSMPLAGTFDSFPTVAKNKFYTYNEVLEILQRKGFKTIDSFVETIIIEFPTLLEALRSIKAVGATCTETNGCLLRLRKKLHEKFSLKYDIGFFITSF